MTIAVPTVQTVLATGVATRVNRTLTNDSPIVEYALAVTVDFGESESEMAVTTVEGQHWISANSKVGIIDIRRADTNDYEDALLDGVRATIANFVNGVGFDVVAHAPEGTTGQYVLTIRGV